MRRSLLRLLPVLLAFAATPAAGADVLLSGRLLSLRVRSIVVESHDAGIAVGAARSTDDPVLGGGRLRVASSEGDVFDKAFDLPAARWRYVRAHGQVVGYVFRGTGLVRSVSVRAGRKISIRVSGGGLGASLGTGPNPVQVVLALGARQYCMAFGGKVRLKAGKLYVAKDSAAPDVCPLPYADDSLWLCRPGMAQNQCFVNGLAATEVHPDLSTSTEAHAASDQDHPFDCFYVYPTVDLTGPVGNHTDLSDVSLMLDPLLSQAARFNTMCRIYAPLYRQITFSTFSAPDAAHFLDLAYGDVRAAFRHYLKFDNGGRPFVIMGHSQGTFMTTRLMQEFVDSSPELRARLITALLIGGSVTVPPGGVVGGTFSNVPLCTSVNQIGCAIAYRSYAEGLPPLNGTNAIGGDGVDTACTNPAALGGGEGTFSKTYFPSHSNQPLFNIVPDPGFGTPFVLFANLYAGECVKDDRNHSYLEIRVRPGAGDQRVNPVPFDNALLSPGLLGTHILDYNWTQGDLLDLVQAKAAAMGLQP